MGQWLALLAGAAEAVDLEGVKQGLEPLQQHLAQAEAAACHRADRQRFAVAAAHAGEVMVIALQGGIDALPIGQLAAAHQTGALQEPQVPIHGGQTMPLRALLEPFMQLLAGELGIRLAQHGQQGLLPGPKGRRALIGGMDVMSHGRSASGATC